MEQKRAKRRQIDGVTHKHCSEGRHWVPEDEVHFAPRSKGEPGLRVHCRDCNAKRLAARRRREAELAALEEVFIPVTPTHGVFATVLDDETQPLSYYTRRTA